VEVARLYKDAGVNPLAGCLPTLVTLPVWIGLYRALSNVADEGLLTEGFFWIPSLAGPTSLAAQKAVRRGRRARSCAWKESQECSLLLVAPCEALAVSLCWSCLGRPKSAVRRIL
jgi:membrane protein insertase Oxa1/YidC/SpoIIIJ